MDAQPSGRGALRRRSRLWGGFCLLSAFLSGAAGVLLVTDRPGLGVEYFALTAHGEGTPVYRDVGPPQLGRSRDVAHVLLCRQLFSLRWRGWIHVAAAGEYRFELRADEAAYLRLDGQEVARTPAANGRSRDRGGHRLESGFHRLEVGLSQTAGGSRLRLRWAPPGRTWRTLPAEALFARQPTLYRPLRRVLSELSLLQRRLLGALLLLAALLLSRPWGRWPGSSSRGRHGLRLRRWQAATLLGVALVATWMVTMPFTASTLGGDDVRYLDAAQFTKKMGWIVHRYAHVYLLKAFMWLREDPYLGSRSYWSFLFAVSVVSLASAARTLGPALQLRTLAIALFLLLSQASVMANIGAALADYSAMMFVTAAVAVTMHGFRARGGGFEWPALVVGALTVGAVKSKETGVIAAYLPLLFLFSEGRFDGRRCRRRMGAWILGGLGAMLLLVILDAWLLGDPWFSLRLKNLAAATGLKTAAATWASEPPLVWLQLVWSGQPRAQPVSFALRHLALLVLLAAGVSWVRAEPIELRLLHLMPILYLLMMVAVHPPIFSSRYLLPILPVSCFLGSALFAKWGVDRLPWRELASPRYLAPLFVTAAVVLLIVAPYRMGVLAADELVPDRFLGWTGGSARDLMASVEGPVVVALLVGGALVAMRHRRLRLVVALVFLLGLFGTGARLTQLTLARKIAVQQGDLLLYPWRAFEPQLRTVRPTRLMVSRQVLHKYGMAGPRPTRERIARLYLRRPHLRLYERREPTPTTRTAIGTLREYRRWQQSLAEPGRRVVVDASGVLVLMLPAEAGSERPPAAHPEGSGEPNRNSVD